MLSVRASCAGIIYCGLSSSWLVIRFNLRGLRIQSAAMEGVVVSTTRTRDATRSSAARPAAIVAVGALRARQIAHRAVSIPTAPRKE